MVLEEEDKVEKYIGGLPDNIQRNVIAAKPVRLQDAIRIANNLIDQKLKDYAIKNAKNKRRFDSNSRDNRRQQQQQQLVKRQNVNGQNVARAYTIENNVKRKGGCKLGLLGHPFNIDLNPVELGSFNVIVGKDWLVKYHAVIVCDEKSVRITYRDEVLIIEGDACHDGSRSKLNIFSCTKTQKYIQKGCPGYIAQVTAKRSDDEPEEKRLEDVPVIRDFLKVFPEDFPGLPPTRQVEF
uniref:Putative reverse transcriptase domain-containing protein n=1 Tax=Tanacetum cinerariifolium TaxID=118510 RepID=A0A699IFT2_TANCI|nr:putative reverse transcriptase domain-containing protein [Tanacetum cinerariifolium]